MDPEKNGIPQATVAPEVQPVAVAPVAPQAPVAPAQPAVLPQDTRADTRAEFNKLLESNRRLFEESKMLKSQLQQRQEARQQFAPIQQPAQSQVNVADFVEVDPDTGEQFINQQRLAAKLAEASQRATRAEQAVDNYIKTSEQREIERQNREALSAYPELNPEDTTKFDSKFSKQVRAALVDSMYTPEDYGGRALSFKEAADYVRSQYPTTQQPSVQAQADAAALAAQAGQELKQQGSAGVTSQPHVSRPQEQDDEEIRALRDKTRFGSTEALAKRLMHTPHILPKDAQEVS